MIRILLVEDHEDTSLLLRTFLEPLGYDVLVIETVADALPYVYSGSFDIYILDTRLPDGTGIELCRRIRRLYSATPIIFYSAVAGDSSRADAMRAGAQAYITKPALPSEVARVVAMHLPHHRTGSWGRSP